MDINTIKNFNETQIENRVSEIQSEMKKDGANLEALLEEVQALEERKNTLNVEAETRATIMSKIADGSIGKVIEQATPAKETRTLDSVVSSSEYESAWSEYVKSNDAREVRTLLSDLVDGGTIPTPTYLLDKIETAWERAVLVSRARHIDYKGTLEIPFEVSATGASIHTEGSSAPAEEQLVMGTVEIKPSYIKKWISVSDTVLALRGRAFLDYIFDEIEQRIAEAGDAAIVAALAAAPTTSTTSAVGIPEVEGTLSFTSIFEALASLSDEAKAPVAIMSKRAFFSDFMSMTDQQGRPIYNIVSENGSPRYYLNGVEVLFSSSVPYNAETGFTAYVGDMSSIVVSRPAGGPSFIVDQYSRAKENVVEITGKELLGVGIVRPGSFVKLTVTTV